MAVQEAHFIQENEGGEGAGIHDAPDALHVARECGERLCQGLLVPNVRVHRIEEGQYGVWASEDIQACTEHKGLGGQGTSRDCGKGAPSACKVWHPKLS